MLSSCRGCKSPAPRRLGSGFLLLHVFFIVACGDTGAKCVDEELCLAAAQGVLGASLRRVDDLTLSSYVVTSDEEVRHVVTMAFSPPARDPGVVRVPGSEGFCLLVDPSSPGRADMFFAVITGGETAETIVQQRCDAYERASFGALCPFEALVENPFFSSDEFLASAGPDGIEREFCQIGISQLVRAGLLPASE